ncbi:MAG: Coq4 family protein [Polyangia bacterium]
MRTLSKHVDYLKALKGFVSILRDPDDTPSIFDITNGLRNTAAFQRMLATMRRDPECARQIAERYQGPPPDLEVLARLPEGTLGRCFAERMLAQGLKVVFYPEFPVVDDLSYIEMRLRSTHDVWHTVTGFGITPAGELGLQAFMLAQLDAPLPAALIGGGLLRSLIGEPPPGLETRTILAEVARGFELGLAARPLFAQKWETGWDRPLIEWQRQLGLPVSGGDPAAARAGSRAAAPAPAPARAHA